MGRLCVVVVVAGVLGLALLVVGIIAIAVVLDAHWKNEFQDSTLMDQILLISVPIAALLVLIFGTAIAVLGWRRFRPRQ